MAAPLLLPQPAPLTIHDVIAPLLGSGHREMALLLQLSRVLYSDTELLTATAGVARADGATRLHVVVQSGNLARARFMLDAFGTDAGGRRRLLEHEDARGYSALHVACSFDGPRDAALVSALLAAGAPVACFTDDGLFSPLQLAASWSAEIVCLLAAHWDVDTYGVWEPRALWIAAACDYAPLVELLAPRSVSQPDEAAVYASYFRSLRALRVLLDAHRCGAADCFPQSFHYACALRACASFGQEQSIWDDFDDASSSSDGDDGSDGDGGGGGDGASEASRGDGGDAGDPAGLVAGVGGVVDAGVRAPGGAILDDDGRSGSGSSGSGSGGSSGSSGSGSAYAFSCKHVRQHLAALAPEERAPSQAEVKQQATGARVLQLVRDVLAGIPAPQRSDVLNRASAEGLTPLDYAMRSDMHCNLALAQLLREAGTTDLFDVGDEGSPMGRPVLRSSPSYVTLELGDLLALLGTPDFVFEGYSTVLMSAAGECLLDIMAAQLERARAKGVLQQELALVPRPAWGSRESAHSAIHAAADCSRPALVQPAMQLLLDAGADINLRTEDDDSGSTDYFGVTGPSTAGSTPLHVLLTSMSHGADNWAAAPELLARLITWILAKGAQLEAVDEDGFTPLHRALLVLTLPECHVDESVLRVMRRVLDCLLAAGANVRTCLPRDIGEPKPLWRARTTPLHTLASTPSSPTQRTSPVPEMHVLLCCARLLAAGADPAALDAGGRTPAQVWGAAPAGFSAVVNELEDDFMGPGRPMSPASEARVPPTVQLLRMWAQACAVQPAVVSAATSEPSLGAGGGSGGGGGAGGLGGGGGSGSGSGSSSGGGGRGSSGGGNSGEPGPGLGPGLGELAQVSPLQAQVGALQASTRALLDREAPTASTRAVAAESGLYPSACAGGSRSAECVKLTALLTAVVEAHAADYPSTDGVSAALQRLADAHPGVFVGLASAAPAAAPAAAGGGAHGGQRRAHASES